MLPFFMIVTPKLLPAPFGLAWRVEPLPLSVAFQLFWMLWLPDRFRVTTQLLVPLTE